MEKLFSLLSITTMFMLLACGGGDGAATGQEESGKTEMKKSGQETSWEVSDYDPATVVKFESLELSFENSKDEIFARLEELHFPVHEKLEYAGWSSERMGDVKNSRITFVIEEGTEVAKVEEYYGKILENIAHEQGWSKEGMELKDEEGNVKMAFGTFNVMNTDRVFLDFFEPAV